MSPVDEITPTSGRQGWNVPSSADTNAYLKYEEFGDEQVLHGDMEGSIMCRPRTEEAVRAPAVQKRNERRNSRIRDNVIVELKSLDGSRNKEMETSYMAEDPQELYLSSEEASSVSGNEDLGLGAYSSASEDVDQPPSSISHQQLRRQSRQDTARIVYITMISKPQIIEIHSPVSTPVSRNMSPSTPHEQRASIDLSTLAKAVAIEGSKKSPPYHVVGTECRQPSAASTSSSYSQDSFTSSVHISSTKSPSQSLHPAQLTINPHPFLRPSKPSRLANILTRGPSQPTLDESPRHSLRSKSLRPESTLVTKPIHMASASNATDAPQAATATAAPSSTYTPTTPSKLRTLFATPRNPTPPSHATRRSLPRLTLPSNATLASFFSSSKSAHYSSVHPISQGTGYMSSVDLSRPIREDGTMSAIEEHDRPGILRMSTIPHAETITEEEAISTARLRPDWQKSSVVSSAFLTRFSSSKDEDVFDDAKTPQAQTVGRVNEHGGANSSASVSVSGAHENSPVVPFATMDKTTGPSFGGFGAMFRRGRRG